MESKYNFSNALFTGNNIAIGDNNKNLFSIENSNEDFTSLERELINLIFENTDNEQERVELISMLKTFRSDSEVEKEKTKPFFFKKLSDLTEKTGIAFFAKWASENLGEYLNTLK